MVNLGEGQAVLLSGDAVLYPNEYWEYPEEVFVETEKGTIVVKVEEQ